MPMADALQLLLRLIRDSGVPHKVLAVAGQFQQSLPRAGALCWRGCAWPTATTWCPKSAGTG